MNYKTKIILKALAASLAASSASALMIEDPDAPKIEWETKIMCLNTYGPEGVKTVYSSDFCDDSKNNEVNKRKILENGCTVDQVAVSQTRNVTAKEKFKIKIKKCSPTNDSDIQPTQL